VVVTGAGGFVAGHLIPRLREEGFIPIWLGRPPKENFNINGYECLLSEEKRVKEILTKIQPEFLIHLATSSDSQRNQINLEDHFNNTVQPAISVAKALPKSIQFAAFFGSCEEYGNGPTPFKEDQPLKCISSYGWAKIASYNAISFIMQNQNFNWCWLRPFLLFGPKQNPHLLIPQVIHDCLKDKTIPLTAGEQSRDFIFINDFCSMVLNLLKKPTHFDRPILNLASGQPRTIKNVTQAIQRIIGKGKLEFGAIPYRPIEPMNFYGSTERFENYFGKYPFTDFEQALIQTIDYFRDH